jgi:hypothetical protein
MSLASREIETSRIAKSIIIMLGVKDPMSFNYKLGSLLLQATLYR